MLYFTKVKAKTSDEVKYFQDIPNVGKAMTKDFLILGIKKPTDLKQMDPFKLYTKLCKITDKRQDPCVLDTYIAVIDFMNGAPARPWFYYTKTRKEDYPNL